MATAEEVLKIAEKEIGTKGGANYWHAMGYDSSYYSQPWCCIFVDWVMKTAGMSIGNYANCLTIQTGLKNAGAVQVDKYTAEPGDILIFEWDRKQDTYDHVGFCEENKGTYLKTIEGNVSNTVARRTRNLEDVRLVFRPKYQGYTGWRLANGVYRHYTNGKLDTLKWCAGEGQYAGKWYYINNYGAPVVDAWVKSGTGWYYLGSDAAMVTDRILEHDGSYYYVGKNGKAVTSGRIVLKVDKDGRLELEKYEE